MKAYELLAKSILFYGLLLISLEIYIELFYPLSTI